MSIVLVGSSSGSITLQEPAVAGTTTLNLPATSGTVVVTGTTPTLNGITFPATQVSSANANTLDDYEEGTYTPEFSASFSTLTYSARTGYYTKVGRLVTLNFFIGVSTVSGGGGNLSITVPFAPISSTPIGQNMFAGYLGLNTAQPTFTNLAFYSDSTIAFVYNSGGTVMNGSQVTNGSNYAGTITYITN